MQQHLLQMEMQMQPIMAAYYSNNVTTDHIQQYLDENKSLILKIVESQNSGKLTECAENQSRLQRNLMYLAAIADSQPQPPSISGQYPSSGLMQQGAHYMQAQQMSQQQLMASRSNLLYCQQPFSVLQQQQGLHSQLDMSSSGSAGLHMLQSEAPTLGGNATIGTVGFPDFVRIGSGKQDIGSSGDGRGGSSSGHSGDGGKSLYLKSAADGN